MKQAYGKQLAEFTLWLFWLMADGKKF